MANLLKCSFRDNSFFKLFVCQTFMIPGQSSCLYRRLVSNHLFNPRLSVRTLSSLGNKAFLEEPTTHTYLTYRKISAPNSAFARFTQTSSQSKHLKYVMSKKYHKLYIMKNIIFLRVLCRFAKYSSFLFLIGTPSLLGMAQLEMVSLQTAVNIGFSLAFYSLLFTGQSFLFTSRLLGKIMISSDEEFVKMSHLSLFGDKRDIYVRPSDIVPLSDKEDIFSKNLQTIRIQNFSTKLFFLPQHGGKDTDFESLEMLLSGGCSKDSKT